MNSSRGPLSRLDLRVGLAGRVRRRRLLIVDEAAAGSDGAAASLVSFDSGCDLFLVGGGCVEGGWGKTVALVWLVVANGGDGSRKGVGMRAP